MAKVFNKEKGLSTEAEILDLRRQGYSYGKIAQRLGISKDTVWNRANKVSAKLQAQIDTGKMLLKQEEAAIADYIREEALGAWRDSRSPAESVRTVEKRLMPMPDKTEEREPQAHGGELRRSRRHSLSGIDREADELAIGDLGGEESIAVFGPDGPPTGYFYNEETGEDTTDEERAEIRARYLAEKAEQEQDEKMVVVERVTTRTTTYRDGNPAYLSIALTAGAQIRSIWGLDAPKESAIELSGDAENPLVFEYLEIPTGEGAQPQEAA